MRSAQSKMTPVRDGGGLAALIVIYPNPCLNFLLGAKPIRCLADHAGVTWSSERTDLHNPPAECLFRPQPTIRRGRARPLR